MTDDFTISEGTANVNPWRKLFVWFKSHPIKGREETSYFGPLINLGIWAGGAVLLLVLLFRRRP